MPKVVKLLLSIFVGLDIFVVGYFGLSQARFALFGEGQIPGGGSALDMALFLIPLFVGYVAGDRLYYFLTYKERKRVRQQKATAPVQSHQTDERPSEPQQTPVGASVWEEGGWDDKRPRPHQE